MDSSSTDPDIAPHTPNRGADRTSVLVAIAHPGRGGSGPRVLPMSGDLVLGRGDGGGAGLTFADSLLSRQHARMEVHFRKAFLEDLGSKNGTVLNGRRLQGRAELSDGDIVFMGAQMFVFRRITAAQAAAITEEAAGPLGPVATACPEMALACTRLRRLARSGDGVLLMGETGVGKEVFARAVHAASGRPGPFVAINCAALPRELVESEIFGYARGAHSQAAASKPGLARQAADGTLFLDEVAEMPAETQAKLLRFLETREWTPLGATSPVRIDVRILAATNRDLAQGADLGLRPDVAARLGLPVRLPPLRARIEDVGVLTWHVLRGMDVAQARVAPSGLRALCLHRWPGNVRELKAVIAEALALAGDAGEITRDHLEGLLEQVPAAPAPGGASGPRKYRPRPSREEIERQLELHQGSVAAVARALDRQWNVIWRCMKNYGLDADRYRGRG